MRIHLFTILLFTTLLCSSAMAQQYPMRNYSMQDGLSHSNVFRVFQDKRGFLWFCTNYGLSRFDGDHFRNYTTRDGLSGNCIMSISEDSTGTKYVSTYSGGITVMTDTSIKSLKLKKGTTPQYVIYTIPFHGSLWILARDSISQVFRVKNNEIEKMDIRNEQGGKVTFYKASLIGGQLYFTSNNGMYILQDNKPVRFMPNDINEPLTSFEYVPDGDYWLGAQSGLIHLKNGKKTNLFSTYGTMNVSDILTDANHNTWAAITGKGILFTKTDSVKNISGHLKIRNIIINDLFEDREGNIWIATHGEGVYRLNSLDILTYPVEDNKMNVYCKGLAADGKGGLYIASIGTISYWKDGVLTPVSVHSLHSSIFIYFIKCLNDKLYIGTPGGLIVRDLNPPYNEKTIMLPHVGSMGALSFFHDSKGAYWSGGYGHLYNIVNGALEYSECDALPGKRINTIAEDHKGNIWAGTDQGYIFYDRDDPQSHLLSKLNNELNNINAIFEDSHQRLWMATNDGLAYKDHDTFKILTTKDGLIHNKCNALAEDKNHILWVGTFGGLNYIDLNNLSIKEYKIDAYPDEVLTLYSEGNKLFAGTVDGLSIINCERPYQPRRSLLIYITGVKTPAAYLQMPSEISLPYKDNKLTIDFIALNFKDPERTEYRYKIDGLDDNWHVTANTSIELSALPGGDYIFRLSARTKRENWGNDILLPIHIAIPIWKKWWFISLSILLLVGGIFLLTRWQTVKYEAKKRSQLSLYNKVVYLKQQALSALINPHFIFNCMNSIQHYLNKHDNDMANMYLADFATLIRMTMEDAQKAFITLEKEISRIKLYLTLEQLRFGDELQYELHIHPGLQSKDIRIPNMILQPYIENAIWHGIMPKNGGMIRIAFIPKDEYQLQISIEDNGVGLGAAGKDEKHNPYGMRLTEERLQLLEKLLKQYYTVSIKNLSSEGRQGTMVDIILPLKPNKTDLLQLEEKQY